MDTNQPQTQDEAEMESTIFHEDERKHDDEETSSLRSQTPSVVSPREYPICPTQYPPSNDDDDDDDDDDNISNQNEDLLLLLDWDDTIFPTTVIVDILQNRDENGFALVSDDGIEELNKLGSLTLQLLTRLINKYGSNNIYIVTNSLDGWIADSLAFAACISKVYKQIELLLAENNITMRSAQSSYKTNTMDKNSNNNNLETVQKSQKSTISTPVIWKQLCFTDLLNGNQTKSSYKHFISIGDQWTDHHSVKQSLHALMYKPIHHIIKLKTNPNLKDMINEVMYINTCFNHIFDVFSCKSNTPFGHCQIQPVIIDYHREEIKYHQDCLNPNGSIATPNNISK